MKHPALTQGGHLLPSEMGAALILGLWGGWSVGSYQEITEERTLVSPE